MRSFHAFATTALLAGLAFAQDCVLTVPANPLSAQGLATPYSVTGCDQRTLATASFVECAIYDGAGNITIYHPLVVQQGDVVGTNFIAPLPVTLPPNPTVGCWFGTNGNSLTLTGPGAGGCVNGLDGVIFGQYAYCGGDNFMQVAEAAVQAGAITVPAPGSGTGGQCPTTRDFHMVDQDQSDNIVTTYLVIGNGTLAQNTPANAQNTVTTELSNGSDNALLDVFLLPALGCQGWQVNSPTAPSGMTASLALNELRANFNPPADASPALVPLNDPMVLQNGNPSLPKVNLYRAGVGQPPAQTTADADPLAYCKNFVISGIWIQQNQATFAGNPSPMPDVAVNLFTFLANRFSASMQPGNLGCLALLNITDPVTLTMDGNGVVTAATINTAPLIAIAQANGLTVSGATATATASSLNTQATSASSVVAVVSSSPSSTSVAAVTQSSSSAAAVVSASPSSVAAVVSASSSSTAVAATLTSLTSTPAGVTLPTISASTAQSSVVLAISGSGTVTVPISASSPPTTSTTSIPTTLQTLVSAASTCSCTVTITPSPTPTTTPACTSASFTRDTRGLLWDGMQWHVPAVFIGVEWIEFAGPAPSFQ